MLRPALLPSLLSAIMAILLYAITLAGTYVYDDRAIIPLDPRVTQHQWKALWTTDYFNGSVDNLYRPLVSTTYAVQWFIHGDQPWAFHLINCLLHAAVAAAVAEFARRCTTQSAACIAGILFALHPIHVEAVASLVGRAELMCALGVFGALLIFLNHPLAARRIIALFLCLVLAILSKEQGLVLPLMLLVLGWCVRETLPIERAAMRNLAILVSWSAAGYLIFREHFLRFNWDRSFLDWAVQPMIRCVGIDRWLMPVVLIGHYAQLLIFPYKLSPEYGGRVIGWTVTLTDPYLWSGFLAVLAWFFATAIAFVRRSGFTMFCLLSLAFSYGLVANILVLIGTNLSERLMYLPSAFFLMLVATLLVKFPRQIRIPLLIILITLGSIRTFTYARRWNDRLNFYVESMEEQPKSTQLYLLVGEEYYERHQPDLAEAALARGCAAVPDSWRMWLQRADVAIDRDRLDEARQYLKRSFDLNAVPDVYFATQGRLQNATVGALPRQK